MGVGRGLAVLIAGGIGLWAFGPVGGLLGAAIGYALTGEKNNRNSARSSGYVCPVCRSSIALYAPFCNNCNTRLSWTYPTYQVPIHQQLGTSEQQFIIFDKGTGERQER